MKGVRGEKKMMRRWLDGMKGWHGRFFAIIMALMMVSVLPVGLIGETGGTETVSSDNNTNGGFVQITSPNGGERFDELVSIEWDFGAPNVDIFGAGWTFDLYYAHALNMSTSEYPPAAWVHIDTLYYNPSANPDTQQYPSPYIWHTGDLPEGEYAVRVVGTYANYTMEDMSDRSFTITHGPSDNNTNGGFVHITSPNGGEHFQGDVEVNWEFGAPQIDMVGVGWTFELFYMWESSNTWQPIDTLYYNPSADPSTQQYPSPYIWDVRGMTEGQYSLKIVGTYANYTYEDTSDGTFTISAGMPPQEPPMHIESFIPDRDSYNVGDDGVLTVEIVRGNDNLAVVMDATCVVYYGPNDGNYIESYNRSQVSLPSPNSRIALSMDFRPSIPTDYFAVAELWDNNAPNNSAPIDIVNITIHVEDQQESYINVWNPHDGDVLAGMSLINWDTVVSTNPVDGSVSIYLIPVYLKEQPPIPVDGYMNDEPTYNYDSTGTTYVDTDGDGIPDENDSAPSDAVPDPDMPVVDRSYIIAEGIDNTGEFVWDTTTVDNFAYQILVEMTQADGRVISGMSGVFFVANDVHMPEPDAQLMMFFTDRTEYNMGDEVLGTAIIGRVGPDDTFIDGSVNMTVTGEDGDVLFNDEEYFYINSSGYFTTVTFAPFTPSESGIYRITASIGNQTIQPVPPGPEPMPPLSGEGGVSGSSDPGTASTDPTWEDSDGDGYYENASYDSDAAIIPEPDYFNWYTPNQITVTIFVHGDEDDNWSINLERPDQGDVMSGFDFIMWTFNGPFNFNFGDSILENYSVDVPPAWFGEATNIAPEEGCAEVNEEEKDMSNPDTMGGGPEMNGHCPDNGYNWVNDWYEPWFGFGNLFVKVEINGNGLVPPSEPGQWLNNEPACHYDESGSGETTVSASQTDATQASRSDEGWVELGTFNANMHIMPFPTYRFPNGEYDMRVTLFQQDFDIMSMMREMNGSDPDMPTDFINGERELATQTVHFSIYNDNFDYQELPVWAEGMKQMSGAVPNGSLSGGMMPGQPRLNMHSVLGEIFAIGDSKANPKLYQKGAEMMYQYLSDAISVTVNSTSPDGKIVILNLDPAKLGLTVDQATDVFSQISVLFDGSEISSGTLGDVINASNQHSESPMYTAIVTTVNGTDGLSYNIKVLVYVPHFSTHTITVKKASSPTTTTTGGNASPLNLGTSANYILILLGIVSVIAILLGVLYANERTKRRDEVLSREIQTLDEKDTRGTDNKDEWERLL